MAFGFFAKANVTIIKFRKLTNWGLLQLWTGNLNTQTLVKHAPVANNLVEKKLLRAIVTHDRTKNIVYFCVVVNVLILVISLLNK